MDIGFGAPVSGAGATPRNLRGLAGGGGASRAGGGARAEEYVAALRALWSTDRGYHGSFFDIPPGRQDPPPVQRPGPPILLGGTSEGAMERAGGIGDGGITPSGADLWKIAES